MADLVAPRLKTHIPQRGFSLAESAAYVGVTEAEFKVLIHDGRMPKPVRILGREIFDRKQIDTCMFGIFGQQPRRNKPKADVR